MAELITPYGGDLKECLVSGEQADSLRARSRDFPSIDLNNRQLCDLELLMNGAFSPLEGFMDKQTYESVVDNMRLPEGSVWPIPITLDVNDATLDGVSVGASVALRDAEGVMLAVLEVSDIWQPDLAVEAEKVFGTRSKEHPAVAYLTENSGKNYVGGKIQGIQLPTHYDHRHLRNTPGQLREEFKRRGWSKVVAFQTRNPMHRAHYELTYRAARDAEANLLIHPVVGMTKPGDVDHYTRVRCYEALLPHYDQESSAISLLPLAMRMGGPREALWHAIIRRNYGCTHLIVGRDHAGPGKDEHGEDFYGPYDAQELVSQYADEIGMEMIPFRNMVYVEDMAEYLPEDEVDKNVRVLSISGTELRRRLREGLEIPEWFSFPEIVHELRRTYPPRDKQGFTVFFTGLSGSGKSTLAQALMVKLMELGDRPVTLLDGDIVRTHLSSELGFSKNDREINVRRIGFVASEITKNRGIAICAPIAPYESSRRFNRDLIGALGGFIEIHISTPVEVCEQRDRKGLYAKARAGQIKGFTGIDDPYEIPENPALRIDTSEIKPEVGVQQILFHLKKQGFLR